MEKQSQTTAHQQKFQQITSLEQPIKQSETNIQNSEEEDPISQYGQNLYEDVVIRERGNDQSQESCRSKGIKRKEKLQKLRSELQSVQHKRQRNRDRHQKEKVKLDKILDVMKQEDVKTYLTARKLKKKNEKERVKLDVEKQIGQPFLIDIAFQHKMNGKQNKSLAIQIQLIVKTLKGIAPSPNIHLCGLREGPVREQLIKMKYQFWPVKIYEQRLEDCLKLEKFQTKKKIYYLSPDATQTLDTIEPGTAFIIGGLVDRSVIKNASLNRAAQLKLQARSLPIRPFMKQRTCLNLDHIVSIICKYIECRDWKEAFQFGAPKRWKKAQGQPGLKPLKKESDYDSSDREDRSQGSQASQDQNEVKQEPQQQPKKQLAL